MRTPLDVQGKRFNRLTVISKSHRVHGQTHWLCRCDCGNDHTAPATSLVHDKVKSCGCLNREMRLARSTKHGMATRLRKHPMYAMWQGIRLNQRS